jgi:hypothetical protein
MAHCTETAINWQPYEEEILSLFVKQNKTLEYVMSHMKQKYGLDARYVRPMALEAANDMTELSVARSSTRQSFPASRILRQTSGFGPLRRSKSATWKARTPKSASMDARLILKELRGRLHVTSLSWMIQRLYQYHITAHTTEYPSELLLYSSHRPARRCSKFRKTLSIKYPLPRQRT